MLAHFATVRLLTQAYENSVNMLKEIQKHDAIIAEQQQNAPTADAKSKKDNKPAAGGADKKSDQKKPPKVDYSLPHTVEQWSQFEPNSEIVQAWSHELMKKFGLNSNTVPEPYMLFLYLDMLESMLKQHGCSHMLFPVYYLQLILVNNLIKLNNNQTNVSLNIYVRMKMINLCIELNLISSVNFHQQQLALVVLSSTQSPELLAEQAPSILASVTSNPAVFMQLVKIDAAEVVVVRDQIYSHKKRMAQVLEEEATKSLKSSTSIGASSKNESLSSLKIKRKQQQMFMNKMQSVKINENRGGDDVKKANEAIAEEIKIPGDKPKVYENLHDLLYRDVWLKVAEQLIECGFFHSARDYLYECLNACVVSRFILAT